MNELTSFKFQDHAVKTLERDGQVWFIAKDICEVLGLTDVSMSVRNLDDDEKLRQILFVSGQNREIILISESGFYKLVFKSRKKIAKDFTKWVTSEVLPSIRTKGGYINPNAADKQITELLAAFERERKIMFATAQDAICRKMQAEYETKALKRQIAALSTMKPDCDFGEISERTGLPRDLLVKCYLRSNQKPHKPQISSYIQLILPLDMILDESFTEKE